MEQKSLQIQTILPILLSILLIIVLTVYITNGISERFAKEYAGKRLFAEAVELEALFTYGHEITPYKTWPGESESSIPFAIISKNSTITSVTQLVFNISEETLNYIQTLEIPENKVVKIKVKEDNGEGKGISQDVSYYLLKRNIKDGKLFVMLNKAHMPGLKSLSLIKEAVVGGGLLILVLTAIILRINLMRPINALTNDMKKGNPLRQTNIKELDQLGQIINSQMKEIEERSEHYIMLHKIAVELNTLSDIKIVLKNIIEYSREILHARFAALAVYDERGRFADLIVSGPEKRPDYMPEGKGILQYLRLSLVPVRIDNIKKHPAFSGSFPEGHPDIESFLGYPVFSSDGRPIGAIYFANKINGAFTPEDESILKAISSDIAVALEREKTLEELKRFKRIIDSAFDMIVITDRDGNIVYVNKAFETVTGYSRAEALGQNPRLLKSGLHDTDFYKNLWQRILSGNPWKGEFINRKKSGELYNSQASIFPLFDHAGNITHFVSIQRDVTEEKKLYEHLLRAQKMEAIGTLAGGIAHDFNNILTSILGYAELLKDALLENQELYRYADIIDKSANRGADLAKKILTVTRKEHAEFRSINLNAVVMETVEILRKSIPKEIEIELKLRDELPNIRADYSQMSQVLMNLAINAKDAMPEGGRLFISTDIVGSENGAANGNIFQKGINFVKLTVEDTGTGIPKELHGKIFDPFFTTKDPGSGTGLGLYIVHSIVTNHGGYINLYSEPGKGTRFNVYLPVYLSKDAEEISEAFIEDNTTGTVLIIDDEPYVCDIYKDVLSKYGFKVFIATEPSEGIRIFKETHIDVVILDLIMPRMSGREVFQILRELNKESKIILSSGYSAELYSDINKMLEAGASSFIQKPVSPKTLVMTLRRILKDR